MLLSLLHHLLLLQLFHEEPGHKLLVDLECEYLYYFSYEDYVFHREVMVISS